MKNTIITPNIENINANPMSSLTIGDKICGIKETKSYRWSIETALGTVSGTCRSIKDLNKEIIMLTNNAKVLKKNITLMTLVNENIQDKIYTWNVITHSGQASGVSVSLEEAKKIINSFGYREVITSKIIESSPTLK